MRFLFAEEKKKKKIEWAEEMRERKKKGVTKNGVVGWTYYTERERVLCAAAADASDTLSLLRPVSSPRAVGKVTVSDVRTKAGGSCFIPVIDLSKHKQYEVGTYSISASI